MSFEVQIGRNYSEPNRLTKYVEWPYTLDGTLRDNSSIINPVIIVGGAEMSTLRECNYMAIPEFGRSYFVTNIEALSASMVAIYAHVDVLSSFKDQLLPCRAIINRQANSPNWNLLLNDGSLQTYQNPKVLTQPFPSGFTDINLIFAVAGG